MELFGLLSTPPLQSPSCETFKGGNQGKPWENLLRPGPWSAPRLGSRTPRCKLITPSLSIGPALRVPVLLAGGDQALRPRIRIRIPRNSDPHTEFRGIAQLQYTLFVFCNLSSLYLLFLWLFTPWHTDRSLHYTPIHASISQRLGDDLSAPRTMRGHSHLGFMGCTVVFY